jgi:peptide deformylase
MIALIPEDDPYLLQPPNEFMWFEDEPDKAVDLQKKLIDNMLYYDGVGLSANQLGLPYRVFVMLHEGQPLTVFNPRVIQKSSDEVYMMEGCLSYPGLFIKVKRSKSIHVQYYDVERYQQQALFSDLSCRIFLHEFDHMQGRKFYEGASQLHIRDGKKKRYINLRKIKKNHGPLWQSHINNKEQKINFQKTL